MKSSISIFLFFCIVSCNKPSIKDETEVKVDTIYGGDYFKGENLKGKRLTVLLDNGNDSESPTFKLNEPSLIRIQIPSLNNYQIYFSEITGADITKVDTSLNYFHIIPKDSTMTFTVNQYYPEGRVVLFAKNLETDSKHGQEFIIPQNGFKRVTNLELKIK